MTVKDVKTNQEFVVPIGDDRAFVTTKDGVKVKLHPVVISTMVRRGQKFDGQTVKGPREMVRV